MRVDRRTFLLGSAALLASPVLAKADPNNFLGEIAKGHLSSKLPFRRICEIAVSSMPFGKEYHQPGWTEDPVHFVLWRDDEVVFNVQMNPRASYRWVPIDEEAGIVVPKNTVLRLVVEGCCTNTAVMLGSNIEKDRTARRRIFYENFKWRDGDLQLESIAAADPADAHVIA